METPSNNPQEKPYVLQRHISERRRKLLISYVAKAGRKGKSWQEIIDYLTREKTRRGTANKERIALSTAKSLLRELLLRGVVKKVSSSDDSEKSYVLASLVRPMNDIAKTKKAKVQAIDVLHLLQHVQIDTREFETRKVLHIFTYDEMQNLSDTPVGVMWNNWTGIKPQTWEDRNPIIEIRVGKARVVYDREHQPKFREGSNPYNLQFVMNPPRKVGKGEVFSVTYRYDERDIEPIYILDDLKPTKELILELIKLETANEFLECAVYERGAVSPCLTELGKGQYVKRARTREEVYALRWMKENPESGRDYKYTYRV